MDGKAQRRIALGSVVAVAGAGLVAVAAVQHQGRYMLARFAALMVLGLWMALSARQQAKQPVRRWWG
jgi:hypothetical protein